MELLIQSTDMMTYVDGVQCRVWEGVTDEGVRCLVMVHRVLVHPREDSRAFDTALTAQEPPARVVDLDDVLLEDGHA